MKTKILFIATSCAALFFTACKKEQLNQTPNNPTNSTMQLRSAAGDVQFCSAASLVCSQNGVLIFPTIESFKRL